MSMNLMASSERVCYVHCNHCNTILAVSVPTFNGGPLTEAAMTTVATVRCGHCANLLSVNIGAAAAASLQYHSTTSSSPPRSIVTTATPAAANSPHNPITTTTAASTTQHYLSHPNVFTHQKQNQVSSEEDSSSNKEYGSSSSLSTSSKCYKFSATPALDHSSTTTTASAVDQPRISPIRPPEKRQRVPSAYNRFIKEEIQRIKAGHPDISHREAFSTAAKNWAHFPHIHFGLKLESNKQARLDNQTFAGEGAQKSTNAFY